MLVKVLPVILKPESRMTRSEGMTKSEGRNRLTSQLRAIGHSGFGFLSSFGIRHSSFNDLGHRGRFACTGRPSPCCPGTNENSPAQRFNSTLGWTLKGREKGRNRKMALLTKLPATAQKRHDASPVRGVIFVGSRQIEIPKLRQERYPVQRIRSIRSIG